MSRPAAVLFDLFGTLITFDASAIPEVEIDGRRVRSTAGTWLPLLEELLPGVGPAAFTRALRDATASIDRGPDGLREISSAERFRAAVGRVAPAADPGPVATLLARAHHRTIATATRFPESHARVLEAACACGPVAVVSNFDDTASAYEILDRHRILPRVATVVVSEHVGLRKPHPLLVEIALRELAVPPSAALFVGDDLHADVGTATANRVDAAWIDSHNQGVPPGAPQPRWIINSLAELLPLLA